MPLPNSIACEKYTLFHQVGTVLHNIHLRNFIFSFKTGTLEISNLTYIILCLSHMKEVSRPFSAALLCIELLTEVDTLSSMILFAMWRYLH